MERTLEKLIRTLQRLAGLYGELLEISREKTQHLVASDVEAIEASQAREDMIVGKLTQLSVLRDDVLRESGEVLGTEPPATVSKLILALGEECPDERTTLVELRDELKKLGHDIGSVNRLNEELCTQSLMHLEGYMSLLTGRSGKTQMYDGQGRSQHASARALVNRSA